MVIAIASAGIWFARVPLGEAIYARAVNSAYGQDATADLPDGLHVILCGTGSPLPDPDRSGPCTLVVAGKQMFLIDAGSSAGRRIGQMMVPLARLDAAFLTHFHSDHIDGLGEVMMLRWAASGRKAPLPVYGPVGVERVVAGFNTAYTADFGYRIAHHGADIMPRSGAGGRAMRFDLPVEPLSLVVLEKGDVRVTAFTVRHDPVEPSVGYRFDYKGRSVVISGDTARDDTVATACNGCDLMVHEALNPDMVGRIQAAARKAGDTRIAKIMSDIPGYHTSPVEAASIARQGKAKMLVLTHIVPRMPTALLHPYFVKGASAVYSGPIIIGTDGMLFSLPARSGKIERDALL